MKLTVKKIVGTYDKTKDGKPFLTKQGKPYSKSTVTFEETGEKLVTVMVWSGQTCNEKQVFDGEIVEREWQGKKYYDLKVVNEKQKQADELAQIKFSITNIHRKIDEIVAQIKFLNPGSNLTSAGTKVPDFIPNTEEQVIEYEQKMDAYENANAELDRLAEEAFNNM